MGIKMDGAERVVWGRTSERWDFFSTPSFFFLLNHFKIAQPIFLYIFWNEALCEQFNGLTVSRAGSPWGLQKNWCEIDTCRSCCETNYNREELWTSESCPKVIPIDPYSGACLLLLVFVHTDTLGGVKQGKKNLSRELNVWETLSV